MAASTMCMISAPSQLRPAAPRYDRMVWAILKVTPKDGHRSQSAKVVRIVPQPLAKAV